MCIFRIGTHHQMILDNLTSEMGWAWFGEIVEEGGDSTGFNGVMGWPRRRWENKNNTDLHYIGWVCMDWIDVLLMSGWIFCVLSWIFRFPYSPRNILIRWGIIGFKRSTLVLGVKQCSDECICSVFILNTVLCSVELFTDL